MFKVVTDIKKITAFNKKLKEQLAQIFTLTESRKFTSPGGTYSCNIHFKRKLDHNVNAWIAFPKKNDKSEVNLFLQGQFGETHAMHIAAQLNFPLGSYNKKTAGVFVEDDYGKIFIAHRGDLTLKGRLKRNDVLDEFASYLIEAQENGELLRLILICELDDRANILAKRLLKFAKQAREVAQKLDHLKNGKIDYEKSSATNNAAKQFDELRSYFKEFSGEAIVKGQNSGVRVVKHGDIVEALANYFTKNHCLKSQEIDLAVEEKNYLKLYEIKTTFSTTDIYTGTGQLLLHSNAFENEYQVQKFLVLPNFPKEKLCTACKNLGIKIVTYKAQGGTYFFKGLL